MLALLFSALTGTTVVAAALLDFSIRLSGAIVGFDWDPAGVALVITAIGGLLGGSWAAWLTFIKDRSKSADDQDLARLKHQAERVEDQMDRYEREILYLRDRQDKDSRRIAALEDRIDELETENALLRGVH